MTRCKKIMEDINLLLVGDYAIGKTSYLLKATTEAFPGDYNPISSECSMNIMIDSIQYSVRVWDSAWEDQEFDGIRITTYPHADAFMVCFDIGNRTSFDNIESKWLPELNHHVPETPKILVGNKSDSGEQMTDTQNVVKYEEAKSLADKHDMLYIENSALQQNGVQDMIMNAVRAAIARRDGREKELKKKQGGVLSYFKKTMEED